MNFASQETLPAPAPLPGASVLGLGAVTALGRDLQSLATLLGEPHRPLDLPRRVTDEVLADSRVSRALRRAGRLPRMAVLAAMDAWDAAGAIGQDVALDRVGVIVATGLGPHDRTFKFLDGILDHGDSSASPTDFSHSVHNAAAAYVTEILGLRGPSCTVTDFTAGFEQAVLLAQVWLAEGACDRVVVGAVEELGDVLLSLVPRMLANASISADVVPGEGACFLTLGPAALAGLAHLHHGGWAAHSSPRNPVDLLVMDDPALPSKAVEGRRSKVESQESRVDLRPSTFNFQPSTFDPGSLPTTVSSPICTSQAVTFSPYFGHVATSSAFQTLGGLLCLDTGRVLGKHLDLAQESRAAETAVPTTSVDSVLVYKRSSPSESPSLLLTRPEI